MLNRGKIVVTFLAMVGFITYVDAATVKVNQVAKSFVGDAPDAKLQEYNTNQDALRAAKFETLKIKVGDSVTFTNVDRIQEG